MIYIDIYIPLQHRVKSRCIFWLVLMSVSKSHVPASPNKNSIHNGQSSVTTCSPIVPRIKSRPKSSESSFHLTWNNRTAHIDAAAPKNPLHHFLSIVRLSGSKLWHNAHFKRDTLALVWFEEELRIQYHELWTKNKKVWWYWSHLHHRAVLHFGYFYTPLLWLTSNENSWNQITTHFKTMNCCRERNVSSCPVSLLSAAVLPPIP